MRRCPQRENRPFHPAEIEAWRLTAFAGAWRARLHPRWNDARLPVLDAPALRALHDPARAPWADVVQILLAIETGARKGAKATETDHD